MRLGNHVNTHFFIKLALSGPVFGLCKAFCRDSLQAPRSVVLRAKNYELDPQTEKCKAGQWQQKMIKKPDAFCNSMRK